MSNRNQLIHIASEVIIIIGMTIYFKKKINSLENTVLALVSKVSSMETILHQHDSLLRQSSPLKRKIKYPKKSYSSSMSILPEHKNDYYEESTDNDDLDTLIKSELDDLSENTISNKINNSSNLPPPISQTLPLQSSSNLSTPISQTSPLQSSSSNLPPPISQTLPLQSSSSDVSSPISQTLPSKLNILPETISENNTEDDDILELDTESYLKKKEQI